jgi:hypothetical protein
MSKEVGHGLWFLGCIGLAACAADADGTAAEAKASVGSVMAALDFGGGHRVELREPVPGFLSLVETAPVDVAAKDKASVLAGFDPSRDSVATLFEGLSERSISHEGLEPSAMTQLRALDDKMAASNRTRPDGAADPGPVASLSSALTGVTVIGPAEGDYPTLSRIKDHNADPGDFDWWDDMAFPDGFPFIFETGLNDQEMARQTSCWAQGGIFNESDTEFDAQFSLVWDQPCHAPTLCSETGPLLQQLTPGPREEQLTSVWTVNSGDCPALFYIAEGSHFGWAVDPRDRR